jgi:hypothetical protein
MPASSIFPIHVTFSRSQNSQWNFIIPSFTNHPKITPFIVKSEVRHCSAAIIHPGLSIHRGAAIVCAGNAEQMHVF